MPRISFAERKDALRQITVDKVAQLGDAIDASPVPVALKQDLILTVIAIDQMITERKGQDQQFLSELKAINEGLTYSGKGSRIDWTSISDATIQKIEMHINKMRKEKSGLTRDVLESVTHYVSNGYRDYECTSRADNFRELVKQIAIGENAVYGSQRPVSPDALSDYERGVTGARTRSKLIAEQNTAEKIIDDARETVTSQMDTDIYPLETLKGLVSECASAIKAYNGVEQFKNPNVTEAWNQINALTESPANLSGHQLLEIVQNSVRGKDHFGKRPISGIDKEGSLSSKRMGLEPRSNLSSLGEQPPLYTQRVRLSKAFVPSLTGKQAR